MDLSRRDFLKEGAAFAAMGGRRGFLKCALAAGAFPHLAFAAPEGGADLRIGILADLHLHDDAGTTRKLERALRFFREARVDGVLVCGDIAHNGLVPQLEEFAAAWQKVFPGDCGLDGMHVEKLFHYGDHDTGGKCHFRGDGTAEKLMEHYGCTRAGLDGMAIAPRRRETWERLFGEPWAPVMHKRVKGYDFVLSQYTAEGHNSAFGLGDFLKGFNPDPRKPFFYSQHRVLRNTAFVGGRVGKGKVFLSCPHPEKSEANMDIVRGAVRYLTGVEPTPVRRGRTRGAVSVFFRAAKEKAAAEFYLGTLLRDSRLDIRAGSHLNVDDLAHLDAVVIPAPGEDDRKDAPFSETVRGAWRHGRLCR
jgi:hypothetical protein